MSDLALAAVHTAHLVRARRALGLASKRRRIPRQRYPTLIESDYAAAIVGVVTASRADLAGLLEALPSMLASAQHARGDIRHDEDETGRVKDLVARGRRRADRAADPAVLSGVATRAAHQVSAHQRGELGRQTRAALGIDLALLDPKVPALVRHFVSENVTLIKSLAGKPLDEIEKLVTRAFTEGRSAEDVAKDIAARYEITERHARLVARDQVSKLRAQVGRARNRELGLASFRWRTMRDPKVRPRHAAREGVLYRYDEPHPEPGIEVCCRCYEEGVFDEILAELGGAPPVQQATRPDPVSPVSVPPAPKQDPAFDHVWAGDIKSARRGLDDAFKAAAYAPRPTITADAKTNVLPKLWGGASGSHAFNNGTILLAKAEVDGATQFAKEYAKDPAKARSALNAYEQARARGADPAGLSKLEQRGAKLHRLANNYSTVVHETLHGYGGTTVEDYKGETGSKVEEIVTEVSARKYMREQFGVNLHAVPGLPIDPLDVTYEHEIHQAIAGIKRATGLDHVGALAALEDACSVYKAAPADITRHPHERLAEAVAKRTRPADHRLLEVAPGAQRRDGSSMTRYEQNLERELRIEMEKS